MDRAAAGEAGGCNRSDGGAGGVAIGLDEARSRFAAVFGELGVVVDVGLEEEFLLVWGWVASRIAAVRRGGVVVVVRPFCEVVCELDAAGVGTCVFEVDDYKLLVRVGWL